MKKILLSIFFIIYFIDFSGSAFPQVSSEQIVFLNMRLVNSKAYLDSIKIVKGKLKQPKKINLMKDHIYYTVLNHNDEKLFDGLIPDPSRKHYEYVDEQGELQSKIVVQDSVYFFVRFPYNPAIYKVKFDKIKEWSIWGWTIMKQRQNMGSFIINLNGKKDEN